MPIAGYRTGFYQTGCSEFKVSGREPLFNYSVNAIIFILLSACARNIMLISIRISLTFSLKSKAIKRQVVFHILFYVFCLIPTKICDRNINITCLFIVLVFEEKANEILTYNAIIVQLILYYILHYQLFCNWRVSRRLLERLSVYSTESHLVY